MNSPSKTGEMLLFLGLVSVALIGANFAIAAAPRLVRRRR